MKRGESQQNLVDDYQETDPMDQLDEIAAMKESPEKSDPDHKASKYNLEDLELLEKEWEI